MQNDFITVCNYFTHHIRNCTAMIVTSITLMANKMLPDEDMLTGELVESSFLLDLFDHGMNTCLFDLTGESVMQKDIMNLEQSLMRFIEHCKLMIDEKGMKLNLSIISPAIIKGDIAQLRTLSNIVIYEMLIQTSKVFTVNLNKNMLTVIADQFHNPPDVWKIFKKVFAARNVNFFYEGNSCTLEYLQ